MENQMTKETKKQELVSTETTNDEMIVFPEGENPWAGVEVESKDATFPKILLQQAMSAAVKDRTAFDGDYLNTLTNSVISDKEGNVLILPFWCVQYTIREKFNGKKFEWVRNDPYKKGDGYMLFETQEGPDRMRNTHVYEFICLLEGEATPMRVPFKSTSRKSGADMLTQLFEFNPLNKKYPNQNWIKLGRKEETSKDGDKYFKMTWAIDKLSTKKEIQTCLDLMKMVKVSAQKIHTEAPPQQPVVENTETRF